MEKESMNIMRLEEARKDTEWVEKVKHVKTVEEYIKLFEEKGIEIPLEEREKIATFMTKNKIRELSDEEMDQAVGGWFPFLDQCVQMFTDRCTRTGIFGTSGECPNFRSGVGYERDNRGYEWELGSCQKGYFQMVRINRIQTWY